MQSIMQFLWFTLSIELNYTVLFNKDTEFSDEYQSPLTKPFLSGLHSQQGVDLSMLPATIFEGGISRGHHNFSSFGQLLKENESNIYMLALNSSQIEQIIKHVYFMSSCQFMLPFLYVGGAKLQTDTTSCQITSLEICTWYVSESYKCKRWQPIAGNQLIKLAIHEQYFFDNQIQEIIGDSPYQLLKISLLQEVDYFINKYRNQLVELDDKKNVVETDSNLNAFVLLTFVCIFIGIVINFFGGHEENTGLTANDILRHNHRFAGMSRRQVLMTIAGREPDH